MMVGKLHLKAGLMKLKYVHTAQIRTGEECSFDYYTRRKRQTNHGFTYPEPLSSRILCKTRERCWFIWAAGTRHGNRPFVRRTSARIGESACKKFRDRLECYHGQNIAEWWNKDSVSHIVHDTHPWLNHGECILLFYMLRV